MQICWVNESFKVNDVSFRVWYDAYDTRKYQLLNMTIHVFLLHSPPSNTPT